MRAGTPARSVAAHRKVPFVLPSPNSRPEPRPTASERASVPVADIALSSSAVAQVPGSGTYAIAKEYTCHGADRSPPLHWSRVPADTKELAVIVVNAKPVSGGLFFDWAVTGLSPSLRGLRAGALPAGAVVGRNSFGANRYSICPAQGQRESYLFLLYALPRRLAATTGFEPESLRSQAMRVARHTGILAGSYGV
ncbi:MAG TPA: YbhB/YbcL family Raf kinase inhibitor-like protein [Solirubrobacteraceae bacterium]|nr:YbhB/YbcL family Raf kinase inhibitor-like protein [Solirubrobacteraceae bacterium]